jgi:hypothetical protein
MLVGISEAIRLLFPSFLPGKIGILFYFPNSTYRTRLLNRAFQRNHFCNFSFETEEKKRFYEWLGGYIDGDGYFACSSKGYVSLEITAHIRDKHCLYQIKQSLGGSVKHKSLHSKYIRYRLHHKKGLIQLIEGLNGRMRNSKRLGQFQKVCSFYNHSMLLAKPLNYENAWLSGMIDSDGSIYLNLLSYQLFITISQKTPFMLEPLVSLYGGKIYASGTKYPAFKWVVNKKEEILNLLFYFKQNPLRSSKKHRLSLIPLYYELKSLKAHKEKNTFLFKKWTSFLKRWENFGESAEKEGDKEMVQAYLNKEVK